MTSILSHDERNNSISDYFCPAEVAFQFLHDKLGIPNAEKLYSHNKANLLDQITFRWYEKIPFQTIIQLARDSKEAPTAEEATQDILDGIGGLCGTHAIGAYYILTAIGYECYPILGNVIGYGMSHAMLIVKDLNNPGDLHLFDVGNGYPMFKAIPLQLSGRMVNETATITESCFQYKFVRDGVAFERRHLAKKRYSETVLSDSWTIISWFKLNPVPVDDVRKYLNRAHYMRPTRRFNTEFLACKYPKELYVGVHDSVEYHEHIDTNFKSRIEKTLIKSRKDLNLCMRANFPEIPGGIVSKALRNVIKY